jgi:hypothetical protein
MHLFTQLTFRPDSKAVSDQQHIYQKLRINRWTAYVAVKLSQKLSDVDQVDKPINRTQQVILWDVVFERKLIK